jgi:hypothetical protein
MHKTIILPVCLGILLVGIVMVPSAFAADAQAAYTMSTYVHPDQKYSIQYPSTWSVEDWDDLLGWNVIFTDSEDWTMSVEIWELGSVPFIDIQSEQERFDGTIAGEKLGCTLGGDSMGYVCRDVEPTGEHGFVTLSSGEVVHSVSFTSVREYPGGYTVELASTAYDFLCCTNHIYQIIFNIDTTNPANIPNETILQIKQDMLESFTFLPVAASEPDPKSTYHLGEDEPITEEFLEEVRKDGKRCDLRAEQPVVFERGMCTVRAADHTDKVFQLGDSKKINYSSLIEEISSRIGTPVTLGAKLIDPSGKIIQDVIIPYHGKLNIHFPETGLAGDYELIFSLYVGAPSGGGKEFVMDWQRMIFPVGGAAQASGGCGQGTVLVDGVCQLAPKEYNDGCGEGTVLKGNTCVLDKSGTSIPPLYIAGGAAAIGAAIIGIIFAVKRGSGGASAPKPARQDLDDYESEYLARQGQRPSPKPAEPKQTSSFCDSCGVKLKPTAKFCGKCGNKV